MANNENPNPPNTTIGNTLTPQQQRAVAEQQAERAEKARATAAKGVDERTAAKEKQVAEYYERKANEQPTPTQRENDLAKVGALDIDDKEDDGSETHEELQHRQMEAAVNNPYATRDMSGEQRPRRKQTGKQAR